MKEMIAFPKIVDKIKEQAEKIRDEMPDDDITALVTLKGGFMIATILLPFLHENTEVLFAQARSYSGTESSGVISFTLFPQKKDLYKKNILLIDDIIDTGFTIKKITERIMNAQPNMLKIFTLLDKPSRREHDIQPDYSCFVIEDKFVFGFGMDVNEKKRNLLGIYC